MELSIQKILTKESDVRYVFLLAPEKKILPNGKEYSQTVFFWIRKSVSISTPPSPPSNRCLFIKAAPLGNNICHYRFQTPGGGA